MKSPERVLTEWVDNNVLISSYGTLFHFRRDELETLVRNLRDRQENLLFRAEARTDKQCYSYQPFKIYHFMPVKTIRVVIESLQAGVPLTAQDFARFETVDELANYLDAERKRRGLPEHPPTEPISLMGAPKPPKPEWIEFKVAVL